MRSESSRVRNLRPAVRAEPEEERISQEDSDIEIAEAELESYGLTRDDLRELLDNSERIASKREPQREAAWSSDRVRVKCKCAGTRRANIKRLIEQFEQQQVASISQSEERYQRQRNNKMRDIITRVRYHNSSSSEASSNAPDDNEARRGQEALDSKQMQCKHDTSSEESCVIYGTGCNDDERDNAYINTEPHSSARFKFNDCNYKQNGTKTAISQRVKSKGVPVLPTNESPDFRRLTELRWQRPTDGSQYSFKASQSRQAKTGRKLINTERREKSRPTTAQVAATWGPNIVRHQASDSRLRLKQLAQIRRQQEPKYHVKRPEKVDQVEQIIEQLEKVSQELRDDDQLMDRAERRDWPASYYEQFERASSQSEEPESSEFNQGFGRRDDMDSLEIVEVSKSHSRITRNYRQVITHSTKPKPSAFADRFQDDLAYRRLNQATSTSKSNLDYPEQSYLLCSAAPHGSGPSCSPFSEPAEASTTPNSTLERQLRHDDLSYRQYVKRKPDPPEPPFGIPRQSATASSHSTASHYLHRLDHNGQQVEQPTVNSWYCTTRPNVDQSSQTMDFLEKGKQRTDSRVSFCDTADKYFGAGRESADSGVAVASTINGSPITRPLVMNNDRSSSYPAGQVKSVGCNDDAVDEEDLSEELGYYNDEESRSFIYSDPICDSPTPEKYQAEFLATPSRLRSHIKLENPRSRSPLLRVATPSPSKPSKVTTTNSRPETPIVTVQCYEDTLKRKRKESADRDELECRYDFDDEEDEDLEHSAGRNIVVVDKFPGESPEDDSSLERINFRASSRASQYDADDESVANITMTQPRNAGPGGPSFSIGPYKSIKKPSLKIL